jgi:hypothetical protein
VEASKTLERGASSFREGAGTSSRLRAGARKHLGSKGKSESALNIQSYSKQPIRKESIQRNPSPSATTSMNCQEAPSTVEAVDYGYGDAAPDSGASMKNDSSHVRTSRRSSMKQSGSSRRESLGGRRESISFTIGTKRGSSSRRASIGFTGDTKRGGSSRRVSMGGSSGQRHPVRSQGSTSSPTSVEAVDYGYGDAVPDSGTCVKNESDYERYSRRTSMGRSGSSRRTSIGPRRESIGPRRPSIGGTGDMKQSGSSRRPSIVYTEDMKQSGSSRRASIGYTGDMKKSGSSRRASMSGFAGENDRQRHLVRCQAGSDRFLSTAKESSPSMPQAPRRIVSPVTA